MKQPAVIDCVLNEFDEAFDAPAELSQHAAGWDCDGPHNSLRSRLRPNFGRFRSKEIFLHLTGCFWRCRRRRAWRATALFFFAACLPELERVQGEYVLYEYGGSLVPCAGTVPYVDGAVPFVAGQLGVVTPSQMKYTWTRREDMPLAELGEDSQDRRGGTIGTRAWGEDPVHVHEVVHMIAGGRATPPFFQEGLAEMFDIIGRTGGGPRFLAEIDFDPRETMNAYFSADVDYAAAGLFVTFLFVRHGPKAFRKFYLSLVWPCARSELEATFVQAFGVTLEAEVEAFRSAPKLCEPDYFQLQLSECTGPTIPWEGTDWVFSQKMRCDTPGVVGGVSGDEVWPSFSVATSEVAIAGEYELSYRADDRAWIRFGPCFGCPWDDRDEVLIDADPVRLHLEPGKYYVRINSFSDEAPVVDVLLTSL